MANRFIDSYRKQSRILNHGTSGLTLDLRTCRDLLRELEERCDGCRVAVAFSKGKPIREKTVGLLEFVQIQLDKVRAEYPDYVQRKQRETGVLPTEMPAEMKERLERAEAQVFVKELEAITLRDKISILEAEQKAEPERQPLAHGPRGHGRIKPTQKFPEGRLVEIDGQSVDYQRGSLVIKDPKSIFDGLTVLDYRRYVIHPYRRELRRRRAVRQDCIKKGLPVPPECKRKPDWRCWPKEVPQPKVEKPIRRTRKARKAATQ
ncbi:MAG: hypothetical protein JXR49_09470 [Acidobacteria bacterium]|nr:hypothetical protein [Acidobacteriota bacterium]